MSADNKIFIRAMAAVNPYGETEIKHHHVLTHVYTAPNLKPIIKKLCGQPLRQASHLVELGVIGAQTLNQRLENPFPQDTRLYVATGLGDVSKNLKLFKQVSPPVYGLAAPFDFINSSANTTAFYVAKLLGLNARNLTVSRDEFSFEAALQLAISDLVTGGCDYALVGGIDETPNVSCSYFLDMTKAHNLIPGQGSGWLFITNQQEKALGEICLVKNINTDYSMTMDAWSKNVFDSVQNHLDSTIPVKLLPGYKMSKTECDEISHYFENSLMENYIQYSGAYYTASAYGMARLFERKHDTDTQYMQIMRNETGATMCVLLRVYPHL